MDDPFDLARFVSAQAGVYPTALEELRAGQKRSHWMWFVFPQLAGLGSSPTAQLYAIRSTGEARAYLAHPLLGPRLHECLSVLESSAAPSADAVFGPIDAVKLRSSLTLFAAADASDAIVERALLRWFGGQKDEATLRLLAGA